MLFCIVNTYSLIININNIKPLNVNTLKYLKQNNESI